MAAPVMTRGLSRADQDQIREALAAGRRPKVVFTDAAGQIAGQTGQVVELTDPTSSDEWITVRFGKDELPFSPADLAIPSKASARGVPTKPTPSRAASAKPARSAASTAPVATAPKAATPEGRGTAEPSGAKAKPRAVPEFVLDRPPATPAKTPVKPTPVLPAAVKTTPELPAPEKLAGEVPETTVAVAQPRPAKPTKPAKPPASLVVTLSYAEREWTLAATQGTRSLAKPYLISPADALRMVALVDVPSVHEAVESIIAAERAEAETRAVKLRAELAELEARLAELAQRP